jgi:anaerobic magnesium-protoporphyrin IX monomethyl ester cyclase
MSARAERVSVSPRSRGVDADGRTPVREGLPPRVVLVKPPIRVPRASYSTLACPPLGLAYLAASLVENDIDVSIVDAVGEAPNQSFPLANDRFLRVGLSDDELLERIPADATCIGVTCMFSEEWPLVRSVIRAIRAAFPRIPIVAGGEHANAAPEFTMRDCPAVDVCVLGEGDETLVELVRHLAEGRPLDGVAGIAYLQDGVFRRTASRPRIRNIDAIPWPAWHLVPLENYLSKGLSYGLGGKRTIPILATRGCPFECTFCSSPQMWTTRWAARDPDDVLAEMRWGVEKYGANDFDFYDLTAILRKDWIIAFCHKLIDSGLNVTWQIPSGTRSEALDQDVLPLLHASGCRYFAYAPESGSPALLKRIKKRVHLDRMKASMRTAVAASLNVKCNIIVGFPSETRREAWETVRFCSELAAIGVQDVNVVPFCPYPGSELFDQLSASGQIPGLGEEYFDMLSMYSDLTRTVSWSEHLSNRELTFIRAVAFTGFYGTSFLRRPGRFISVARNFYSGRQETRLDRALGDLWQRRRRSSVPA